MASSSGASNTSKRSTKLGESNSKDGASSSSEKFSDKDLANGKRMKKDDSGINVIPESDISDGSDWGDSGNHGNASIEASKSQSDESERESADSGNLDTCSPLDCDLFSAEDIAMDTEPSRNSGRPKLSQTRVHSELRNSSDDDSGPEAKKETTKEKEETKNYDPTPNTPRPKHKWIATNVISSRQYGYRSKYSPDLFRYNCYGSLHMVERLELMYKMKKHDGCVNALNFNSTGTRLVSGSDDLHVIVWDWIISEPVLDYRSGHGTNVFQAKYIPLTNDSLIVTCARDGQVRLGELSSDGTCIGTRKLVQHKGSAHRLSVQTDSPHNLLTCGEDAAVFAIDLRQEKHDNKLLICKSKEKRVPLYSIFINPNKSHEFAVGGRSQFVKVYDTRFIKNQSDGFVKEFCPEHLVDDDRLNITSLVYNYNGQEILASYNDEDIYIFDNRGSESTKFMHWYRGHRNNQTVKGVNYFGPKSEYIMSGSDCGYIFFWEKESEHIVKYMYGDEGGAVNCLEPNPTMPVLATSGLDDDIKIWVPSCEEPPDLSGLKSHLIRNMKGREEESNREYPDDFVDQTIWLLMQHLSRARRMPRDGSDQDSDSSTASSDEVDDSGVTVAQCNQS